MTQNFCKNSGFPTLDQRRRGKYRQRDNELPEDQEIHGPPPEFPTATLIQGKGFYFSDEM